MDSDARKMGLPERLKLALGNESVNSLAKKCDISEGVVRQYLKGAIPGLDKAVCISAALNIRVEWLATGEGPMRPSDTVNVEAPSAPPTEMIDEVVMGRLNDGISAVYKELGQAIAPVHLGRLAARLYNEVTAAADKPDEIEGAIKMRLAMLRNELRAAETEPLKGKRSA